MAVPRCGMAVVSFLPQIIRFPADFWAVEPPPPNQGHVEAI